MQSRFPSSPLSFLGENGITSVFCLLLFAPELLLLQSAQRRKGEEGDEGRKEKIRRRRGCSGKKKAALEALHLLRHNDCSIVKHAHAVEAASHGPGEDSLLGFR